MCISLIPWAIFYLGWAPPCSFPGEPSGKNPPASAGDVRDENSIPGSGRSPGGGHGNPLQYFCLENPMGRGVWQVQSMGIQRVRHDWSDLACTHLHALSSPWCFDPTHYVSRRTTYTFQPEDKRRAIRKLTTGLKWLLHEKTILSVHMEHGFSTESLLRLNILLKHVWSKQ